ncbi:MAG: acetolactate synthase large subunit [Magnetovibrio sp.]|nr:acetolactate synthase large subunit [Magnetovibrio sp.]
MNGAESLVKTLLNCGIEVCFTNPGTSEMHFLAALDSNPAMRSVLGLQEGVVTGAADGYARMAGKPACTLLHCGPGLANGLSNLHNARRAKSPIVNIVGDHATYHKKYNSPLTTDVEATAKPYTDWVKTAVSSDSVSFDGAKAVAEAKKYPGKISTLVLPADISWGKASKVATSINVADPKLPSEKNIRRSYDALKTGKPTVIFCTGDALMASGLEQLDRIATATGCKYLAQTSNRRIERGFGRCNVERLPYPTEEATKCLEEFENIILLGTSEPAGFFAYPNKPSRLSPKESKVIELAGPEEDVVAALDLLLDSLGNPKSTSNVVKKFYPERPVGDLDAQNIGVALARQIPENSIIADESITVGRNFFSATLGAAPHDWLHITGGSIGCGMPQAVGAAIACPDRNVINLQADGSAMYSCQSLWTQAREDLNVVTLLFANHAYNILQHELKGVGVVHPGQTSIDMTTLDRPKIDWVTLAKALGVSGTRVQRAEDLDEVLADVLTKHGPYLIEVNV